MPPGQSRAAAQELALLEDALAQLVDAHRVDEPLHAGADLVVAVAVVVERAQARLDRRQQVLAGGELLERLRGVRVGAEAAGDEHLEAGFRRAVGERAWLTATTPTSLNIAWPQSVAQPEKLILNLRGSRCAYGWRRKKSRRRLGPRRDVEHLVRARAGEVAAHDVAHGVAARLARREADRREQAQDLGRLLELRRSGTARSGGS